MSSICSACHAPIDWVKTEGGKWMPLDLEPRAEGNVVFLTDSSDRRIRVYPDAEAAEAAQPGRLRYRSHFVTCVDADSFRRKKE